MSVIKVVDLAYVRVRAPDLALAQQFLTDFGMVVADRTDTALYMRGSGASHHIHVTELGSDKFVGFAFVAASELDLEKVAALPGASAIEEIREPGGGKRVWLADPDGNKVEIVHGIALVDPVECARHPLNDAKDGLRRAGTLSRHTRGPSRVLRIGHGVVMSLNPPEVIAWYRETLGLLCSDEVKDEDNTTLLSFNRLDRGSEFVDHHVLLVQSGPTRGVNHVGFELQDVDDLMLGHDHLVSKGYDNVWAIGRHVYGAQIFDYWMDPFGFMYEHWTDTDRVNADFRGETAAPIESAFGPWGADVPDRFFTHAHE
jgi:catechol 2,3-dioxygenase-like lactoylglutathione lyase family enzyme